MNKELFGSYKAPKSIVIGYDKNGKAIKSSPKTKITPYYVPKASKNGKDMMLVPVKFVTLPQNFYIHARKFLKTGSFKGKEQYNTYVVGCCFTKNNKQYYVVAQLSYMGGKPAVAQTHYRGYSKRDAWKIFKNIPFHRLVINQPDGKSNRVFNNDGSYNGLFKFYAQKKK